MKKLFFILVICLFICGCASTKDEDNDYSNFKHYSLKDKEINSYKSYTFNTYAVARLDEYSEIYVDGLFYRVGEDDYILLDEIISCQDDDSLDNEHTFFYTNEKGIDKLYTSRCLGRTLHEFTLNGEKFEKKELVFDNSKISYDPNEELLFENIVNVEKEYIYYEVYIEGTTYKPNIIAKCSLITYECEKYEE